MIMSPLNDEDYAKLASLPKIGDAERDRISSLLRERARRKQEALHLFRAMPNQEPFFASRAPIRIIRGGNRSGKSRCMYTELARAATGQDPYGKFPTDRPLLIYLLTYDADTIGRVAYQMLFGKRRDRFLKIKDLETGEWRMWQPWSASDAERVGEAKMIGPLIPERMYDDKCFSFDEKRKREFSSVTLKMPGPMNGTVIRAYSSRANPAMGDPVDLVAIDEDLYDESWIGEMEARLSDNNGRLIWSAWPKTTNNALIEMSARAAKWQGRENPDVEEFRFRFSDNAYIPEEARNTRIRGWSVDERRARDYGEFLTDNVLMYPDFSMYIHGVPRNAPGEPPDKLELFLEAA